MHSNIHATEGNAKTDIASKGLEAKAEDTKDGKIKDLSTRTATFKELFSTAEVFDYFLMFFGCIGGIATGLSMPFFNILFGNMMDELNKDPNGFADGIAKISLNFVAVAAVNLVSGTLQVYCWTFSGERQSQKLREKYVYSILSQEIGWFDMQSAGELSTKVAEYTGKVEDGLGKKVGDLTQFIFLLLGSFGAAFYLCWELTVVLLAAIPVIGLAGGFMIYSITEAQNGRSAQNGIAGGIATEALSGIRTISALNAQVEWLNNYRKRLIESMRIGIKQGFNIGLGNGLLFGACFIFYGFGFWYGARIVIRNMEKADGCMLDGTCVTGGTVMSVFFCVIIGSMALGQIAPPMTAFFGGKASLGPMMDVIDRKPLIDSFSEEGSKPDKKELKGHLELKNVCFSYPSRPAIQICKGYNLSVKPGESIALVGKSGCGKSTIVNLLLRFYDPQAGQVFFDGMDIKDLNIRWLRSNFGYVGQEPVLFSGTILDNIAYGIDFLNLPSDANGKELTKDDIRERVMKAAKQANAHDFIMSFPDNYNTDVGSNGSLLSGGQKQRVAIARALIRQPTVLLLDEATSALDATSERVVQDSIDALNRNRQQTLLIIAHRLSTIRNATKIAVVNEGVVAELGSHDELITANSIYADLVRLQMTTGTDSGAMLEGGEATDSNASSGDRKRTMSSDKGDIVRKDCKKQNASEDKSIAQVSTAQSVDSNNKALSSQSVNKEEKVLSAERTKEVSSRIWAYILQHPVYLFIGITGAMFFGGVFPIWGFILSKTQKMFYYVDTDKIRQESVELAGWYCLMGVVSIVSSTCQFWGISEVGERVAYKLRMVMFRSLLRREMGFFDREENAVGVLTTKLTDDSRIVLKATGEAMAKQVQAFFTLAVGVILGFTASWKIALVVLATFPLNIIASSIQMQAAGFQGDTAANDDYGDSHGAVINAAFTHMKTVVAFSMQRTVSDDYNSITRKISDTKVKKSFLAGFAFGASQCILFLTYALLFWYGSSLIEKENLSFEKMMRTILCLMLGAMGLGQAVTDLQDSKSGFLAADRVFEMADAGDQSPIDGLSQGGSIPLLPPPTTLSSSSSSDPSASSSSLAVTTVDANKGRGRIEIRSLKFSYPTRPDVNVCQGYSLTIEPGQVVALVGPSGSGKSTIMNLLLRFYDPIEGQILLDGVDIKDLNIRWLRSQIGYVGQEPILFTGSVEDNVARGKCDFTQNARAIDDLSDYRTFDKCCGGKESPKIEQSASNKKKNAEYESVVNTPEDIEEGVALTSLAKATLSSEDGVSADVIDACKLSNAHEFVSNFPTGYNTDVGENSTMVSGGQKQRIAIARALVKRPCVLLLDEATSALDASSEKMVQESIDRLQNRNSSSGSSSDSSIRSLQTIVIIAHRLTTIRNADKIAVIDGGRVVEQGTHDELLAMNGLYHQLWNKQSGQH